MTEKFYAIVVDGWVVAACDDQTEAEFVVSFFKTGVIEEGIVISDHNLKVASGSAIV